MLFPERLTPVRKYAKGGIDENQARCSRGISFEILLKKFPDTDRREEVLMYMAKGYYEFAEQSIPSKQRERYEKAIDSYNNLLYIYPDSEYLKSLEKTVNQKSRQKLVK